MRHALSYAAMGWKVIPIHNPTADGCSCGRDCGSPGKHPRTQNGVKDATADSEQIAAWSEKWPGSNLAVATGSDSGIVVLDVDRDKGGLDSLYEQVKEHGPFDTLTAITGGGGRHYLFQHPGGRVKNAVDLWPGVDVRADGGYIVAPPSEHVSGERYEWENLSVSIKPLPDWLLSQLPRASERRVSRDALVVEGRIKAGRRNDTLTRMAGAMRRVGFCRAAMTAALHEENEIRCKPPLSEEEVESIASSVSRYTPEQQRRSRGRPGMDSNTKVVVVRG